MKPEWLDFLKDAGAEVEDNQIVSFGNPQREQRVIHSGLTLCDLSHQGLISVDGEDSADFLHIKAVCWQISEFSNAMKAFIYACRNPSLNRPSSA